MMKRTKPVRTVDDAIPFRSLQVDFAGSYMLCFVGYVYRRPYCSLLSRGEAIRDDLAQYISMQAPEMTQVVPNGSHYRDSQHKYTQLAFNPEYVNAT